MLSVFLYMVCTYTLAHFYIGLTFSTIIGYSGLLILLLFKFCCLKNLYVLDFFFLLYFSVTEKGMLKFHISIVDLFGFPCI